MQVVRFRVDLSPICSIGPGKVQLLEEIARTGSLSQAAAHLGMSYRYAWLLLDEVNRTFEERVTLASVGGSGGGGVILTTFGSELVQRYRAAARRIDAVVRSEFAGIVPKAKTAKTPRGAGAVRARSRPGHRRLAKTRRKP